MVHADWPKGDPVLNLQEATVCYQRALAIYGPLVAPLEYAATLRNLGSAYVSLSTFGQEDYLLQAIRCYEQALAVYTREGSPADHQRVSSDLGDVHLGKCRWLEAHMAYDSAIAAVEMLYQAAAMDASRQSELAEGAGLYRKDAYCLARLGRWTEAVERLESARARTMTETLARDRAAIVDSNAEDRRSFEEIRDQIRILEAETRSLRRETSEGDMPRRFVELSARLGKARNELSSIIERIRTYIAEFMPTNLSRESIAAVSTPDCPLVYLATTSHGSLALIVPHTIERLPEAYAVWIDGFAQDALDRILYGGNATSGFLHAIMRSDASSLAGELESVIPVLGERLMDPVAERLLSLGYHRCMLIACGRLSVLPLHAARLPDGRYVDQVVEIDYAPCARVLLYARQRAPKHGIPSLFAVVDPPHRQRVPVGDTTVLLGEPRLPYAHVEVRAIAALFPQGHSDILWEEEATRAAVLTRRLDHSHLHFSCHGLYDSEAPLASSLALSGEDELTLADILDSLELSARVAVLSACRTAITDFRHVPDEFIGLPAGFMQAGASSVIGTLWTVHDISTALLLRCFYRYHLEDGLTAASALHRARQWLRASTADELDLVSCFMEVYERSGKADVNALAKLEYYQTHGDEKPFVHPYHWAQFAFYGVDT